MQPMGRLSMHSKCLEFFLSSFGGQEDFFKNSFVPKCVPFKFPMGSHQVPSVFPIAPHFNPMGFAQSPPVLTYIGGPKGEALHLSIESSILGSLHSFNLFLQWANQSGSLGEKKNQKKRKKLDL